MRWIVLLQAGVWLLVAPIIRLGSVSVSYRFDISLIAIGSIVLGILLTSKFSRNPMVSGPSVRLADRRLDVIFTSLSLVYVAVSVTNDLMNRRQGSEEMALRFAELPLFDLFLIRLFEILLPAYIVIACWRLVKDNTRTPWWALTAASCAFLFSGSLDSRARWLTLALIGLGFVAIPLRGSRSALKVGLILTVVGVLGFAFVGVTRSLNALDDARQTLSNQGEREGPVIGELQLEERQALILEWVARLDGLELISRVSNESNLSWHGTGDFGILKNSQSMIPFLPSAKELKLSGQTAPKNYILKNVLQTDQLDTNNSAVTDVMYFGGLPLLTLVFTMIGAAAGLIDRALRSGSWRSTGLTMAGTLAIGLNLLRLEADTMSIVLNSARDFAILFVFILMTTSKTQVRESGNNDDGELREIGDFR